MTELSRRQMIASGAAVLLAGCSGSSHDAADDHLPDTLAKAGGMDALVAKARAEGQLLIYGSPSQDKFLRWTKQFEKRFGIPVQYYRSPSNAVYQRFVQEQHAGRRLADILSISDLNVIADGAQKRMIARYTPQTAAQFPATARLDGIAYPLFVSLSAVGWNTSIVPADLQRHLSDDPLAALLDPRLKGRIVMVDVSAGGPQLATSANLVVNLAGRYGWPYLSKLAAQQPMIVRTGPVALDGVTAGDYWVAFDGYDSLFAPQAAAGAPIAFRYPDPVAASPFYLSVARHAAHPYAARLFAEWAASLEAQNSLAVITNTQVLIKGFQDARPVRTLPWYRAPDHLYLDWQTDPRFQHEDLRDFYRRWHTVFGG